MLLGNSNYIPITRCYCNNSNKELKNFVFPKKKNQGGGGESFCLERAVQDFAFHADPCSDIDKDTANCSAIISYFVGVLLPSWFCCCCCCAVQCPVSCSCSTQQSSSVIAWPIVYSCQLLVRRMRQSNHAYYIPRQALKRKMHLIAVQESTSCHARYIIIILCKKKLKKTLHSNMALALWRQTWQMRC